MPSAVIEFNLTDRPTIVEIFFEDEMLIEDVLKAVKNEILSSSVYRMTKKELESLCGKDFLSSVIITVNGKVAMNKTPLSNGDRIKVFHLLEGR